MAVPCKQCLMFVLLCMVRDALGGVFGVRTNFDSAERIRGFPKWGGAFEFGQEHFLETKKIYRYLVKNKF